VPPIDDDPVCRVRIPFPLRNFPRLMRRILLITLAWAALDLGVEAAAQEPSRPNVLFIAVDDLRDWLGYCQRHPQARTPNFDRLARRGVAFTRAYCTSPACNPSRTALMSGLRASTTGVYDNDTDFRPRVPAEQMLTHAFRRAGYYVHGAGKIHHDQFRRPSEWDDYLDGTGPEPAPPPGQDAGVGGIRFAALDCRDEDLPDFAIADYGRASLQRRHARPFFLAIGFHKPHLPWNVPRKYFDQFPLDQVALPPYLENDLDDIPPAGLRMANMLKDHEAVLASGRWKEAVQAYLAAIAYCDMNLGRLLDALDGSAYRDNTIVCLWGDHGWHLGEKHHWRKFALWEEACRAPLIWSVPGTTRPGSTCARAVDFLSIYPTLMELCGIPLPEHVEGTGIVGLLRDPQAAWEPPALTTHKYRNHALRSERWRYIRYASGEEELYDEAADPHEWTNLAGSAEFAAIKADLARRLPRADALPADAP
jgi:arylsulfatase A-like enzyme